MIQVLETPATTQIEAIVTALIDAWNRHDMASFGALFAEDADFVNVVGTHWRGRAEIEAVHVRLHDSIFRDSRIQVLNSTVKFLRPDVALTHLSCEMTGGLGTHNWKVPEVRRTEMSLVLVPAQSESALHAWTIAAVHNTEVLNVSMKDVDGK